MEAESEHNQCLVKETAGEHVPYAQLAEILLKAIPSDRRGQWAGKILSHLAQETLTQVSQGKAPPRISTKGFHSALQGNPKQEPSAWLSPIWKEIEGKHLPEIEPSLMDLSRQAGLDVYPALQKDEGKPVYYRLVARTLPPPEEPLDEAAPDDDAHTVVYTRDLSLQLSWLGRLLFSRAFRWTPLRRFSFLAWQILFILSTAALVCLLWLGLWTRKDPLAGSDLVLLTVGLAVPWYAYKHLEETFRLFDDRIIVAPEWMLSWKERGATIEITRSREPGAHSKISVCRYSTKCPVCGWMVKLDNGNPDFPTRIVGRCEENPREHVFSFDRSTKLGSALRSSGRART